MDVFLVYTLGSAVWLAAQAVPLFATPQAVIMLLAEEAHRTSDVEVYLARCLALSLVSLAVLLVIMAGSFLASSESQDQAVSQESREVPYAVPVTLVSTLMHSTSAVYTYVRFTWTGYSVYALAAVIWIGLASLGLWCLMFGTDKGHISKRTGADKRVSGWPFRNVESDKKRGKRRED